MSEQACSPALRCCLMQSSQRSFRLYDRLLPPEPQSCIAMAATTPVTRLEDSRSLTAQYQALQMVTMVRAVPSSTLQQKRGRRSPFGEVMGQEATAYRAQAAQPMAAAETERMQWRDGRGGRGGCPSYRCTRCLCCKGPRSARSLFKTFPSQMDMNTSFCLSKKRGISSY